MARETDYFDDKLNIHIEGSNKDKRAALLKATLWATHRLNLSKFNMDIDIDVLSIPPRDGDFILGYASTIDNNYRPRWFQIELNRCLDLMDSLSVLFHEMTHVKQYIRGELKIVERPAACTKWLGEEIEDDVIPYDDLPWEQEATEYQTILLDEYLEIINR